MNLSQAAQPTLISVLWPDSKTLGALRPLALVLIGSLLVAISAKIQVPFWPVPMTMQTFAVLVIGMAYGWRLGGATLLAYLAEGAVGLPVFASGGGLAYFAGPTTGYLIGFLLAATLVGCLAQRGMDRNVVGTLIAMTLGTVLIFLLGAAWLTLFLASAKSLSYVDAAQAAFASGVAPFIVGALAKIALAAAVLPFAWKLVGRARTSEKAS